MISSGSRRHSRAAPLLRRLSTGNDHARRRAATHYRLAVRSPLCDAGSLYRDKVDRDRHPFNRFPTTRSMLLGNTPPAQQSP
jgi:hypothetical protein